MAIKKLEKIYWNVGGGAEEYVLASAARAREDALLEALKIMVRDANKSGYIVRMNSYKIAQDTIRQIEATR
jgi:hypothetical protein